MGILREDIFIFMTISRWIILKMFSISVVEKIQDTQVICSNVFRKSYCLCDNIEKCGGFKEAADSVAPARGMLDK
jgi:hypothetical protein